MRSAPQPAHFIKVGQDMDRPRAHIRQRASIEAKVLAPDLSTCVECTIDDISPGGALVSLRSEATVPDRIYLWQAQTQTNLECEVRWRKLNLLGLQFVAPHSAKVRALIRACYAEPPAAAPRPHKFA